MRLTTDNLDLVLRTRDDVLDWIASVDPATRAEISPDWIARVEASVAPDPWTHGFVMVRRASGACVGSCAFKGPPDEDGAVEIGYGVDTEHRGKGFATEAALAMTHFALGRDDVRVVRAHTLPDGFASIRVLEKCGFEMIGEVTDPDDGLVVRWETRRGGA